MIEYLVRYFGSFAKYALISMIVPAIFGCSVTRAVDDSNAKSQSPVASQSNQNDEKIDSILSRLDKKSREIKTYEARINYLFKQPVLESEALRTGKLSYENKETGSKLRINFSTLRQDNEPVPDYREEYLFDGVNLMRVDYRIKNVEYRQLADSNKPLNAFELASRYLPIIGFGDTGKLRNDFDVSLSSDPESNSKLDELLLKPKPESPYSGDYNQIRFWVDKQSSLPVRIEAISPDDDIYDIRFQDNRVNKGLPQGVFNIEVPADFGKNTVPLNH